MTYLDSETAAWVREQVKDALPPLRTAIEKALPFESAAMCNKREVFVQEAETAAGLLALRWRMRTGPQWAIRLFELAEKAIEDADLALGGIQPWADVKTGRFMAQAIEQKERALAIGKIGSGLDNPDDSELAERREEEALWEAMSDAERKKASAESRKWWRDQEQQARDKWEQRRIALRVARAAVREVREELNEVGPGPRAGVVRSALRELASCYELTVGRIPTATAADRGRVNAKQSSPFERIARAFCKAAGLGMRRVDLLVALADYRLERTHRLADEAAQADFRIYLSRLPPSPPPPRRR